MDSNKELEKLLNMNISELLSEDESKEINDIISQVGMEDWVYDSSDQTMKLSVKLINKSRNPDPTYQKMGDSGFDFMANLPENETLVLNPLKRLLIPTGLHFKIPYGFELQVRSRSGLALKNGIMVLNSPGTVDAGYIGEVKVILYNTSEEPFIIKNGDRIAQGVISPVQFVKTIKFTKVNELEETDRSSGGFGSTGV